MLAASAMQKQTRRTVRSLSVQEKVQAIDRVHDGESKASVARDLGVPESTLRGWCKGEEKLRGIVARSAGNTSQSSCEELTDPCDLIQLKPDMREYTTKIGLGHNDSLLTKRDLPRDNYHQGLSNRKYPKYDDDVGIGNNNVIDSPINLQKVHENGISSSSSAGTAAALHSNIFTNSLLNNELKKDAYNKLTQSLPALVAVTSAINNKTHMLYNSYIKQHQLQKPQPPPVQPVQPIQPPESATKPLDLTKLNTLPRPDMNEAVMYWLQAQREQAISPMEARTADSSSWFWKWYKNYGVLPPVTSTTDKDKTSDNSEKTPSDDEDEPPATPADALRHGEKFLRWLECCSDPSVTALQILQFRYLLNNVKECAERKARQVSTKVKSRRK